MNEKKRKNRRRSDGQGQGAETVFYYVDHQRTTAIKRLVPGGPEWSSLPGQPSLFSGPPLLDPWIRESTESRPPANQGAALGRLRQDYATKTGVAIPICYPFVTAPVNPWLVHTIGWPGGTCTYCVMILYGVLY